MAFDSNRAANEAAARTNKLVQDQHQTWLDQTRQRGAPGGTGQKLGSPLGFVIVVGLMVLVGLWIASMQ